MTQYSCKHFIYLGIHRDDFTLVNRDYTNPYLPVAPTGQDPGLAIQAPTVGAPGEGNVLLCAVCCLPPKDVEMLFFVINRGIKLLLSHRFGVLDAD